jgi:hypothetical protein
MLRWFLFLIAIGIGLAGGLYFGWVINAPEYIDTAPDTLRQDYKADYVLMVAEAYSTENDLGAALDRLGLLGGTSPSDTVAQATLFAVRAGYAEPDLALMQRLADALRSPTGATP